MKRNDRRRVWRRDFPPGKFLPLKSSYLISVVGFASSHRTDGIRFDARFSRLIEQWNRLNRPVGDQGCAQAEWAALKFARVLLLIGSVRVRAGRVQVVDGVVAVPDITDAGAVPRLAVRDSVSTERPMSPGFETEAALGYRSDRPRRGRG
jgi:hypothetical protein